MPRQKGPKIAKGKFDPEKQVRFDFEYAKRCIVTDNGVEPMFVVHSQDAIIPVGWKGKEYNDDGKLGHRRLAKLICVAYNAYAVAFVGEAWIASSLPDEPDPEFPRVRVKDREDRREVIIAQLMWRDKETGERWSRSAQAEIVRNAKGVCTGVTSEEFSEPTTFSIGNFTEILLNHEATFEEQKSARRLLETFKAKPPS